MTLKYKGEKRGWLGSKIYATTPAIASLKSGDLLGWRLAEAHPLGSKRQAIALTHYGEVVGYLEDRFVAQVLNSSRTHHVHVTARKLRKGLRCAVVRFYPRVIPAPEARRPYAD